MISQFNQPRGSTSIEVNKQSIARNFGVKEDEVIYFTVGIDLGGFKVIYDESTQRAYSLPSGIVSGTTAISLNEQAILTHSAGSVDLGELAVSREEYVTLPGSFNFGHIINVKNELLVHDDKKYRWDGTLPKVVPVGSTPETTGGVGLGAWLSVGDATLRGQISDPDGATSYPELQIARWRDEGDVRGWGAVGDGVADDSAAIQAALAGGNKRVYIPAGTYLIKQSLRVQSHTTISMDKGAVILNDSAHEWAFVNGEIANPTYSFGYSGDYDIAIIGGTIDNILKRNALVNSAGIGFAHGDNIRILGVTFKNNYSSHFVEINSSRNVLIYGCTFDDLIAPVYGSRECINIDWSNAGGFPAFGGYDGTVCDNVTVASCTFINGDVAVGSHGAPSLASPQHKNIKFIDNHIENMISGGIGCQFWKDSSVVNNTLKNVAGRNIMCWGAVNVLVRGNNITGSTFSVGIVADDNSGRPSFGVTIDANNILGGQSIGSYGIRVEDTGKATVTNNYIEGTPDQGIFISTGCRDVSVLGNTLIGTGQRSGVNESIIIRSSYVTARGNVIGKGTYTRVVPNGIFIDSTATSNVDVSANTIRDISDVPVNVHSSLSGVIVDDAYVFVIPTNSVVTVPMNNVQGQGVFNITSSSLLNSVINGTVWARGTTGNAAIKVLVKAAGDQWGATTGVLTGTTGTSGFMTVSAGDDRKLYIENRTAGSVQVTCTKIRG